MGQRLKARRKHDELDVMQSYVPLDAQVEDPADHDPELRKMLEDSSKIAESKMTEVITIEECITLKSRAEMTPSTIKLSLIL